MSEITKEDIAETLDLIFAELKNINNKLDIIINDDDNKEYPYQYDPRSDYDIASFIYGKDNSCTILSKAWTSEEVDAKIAHHKSKGCNHYVIDALNSNNWSEDSLPDYWSGVRRQDVHVDNTPEDTQRCIDILTKIRDAGMTIAAYHANDGRDDINNESVWTDAFLSNYWRRFMRTIATTRYKDGSPLIKEIIFKREFDDVAERSIGSVIRMLQVIRSEMVEDQTLWTHNESFNVDKFTEVFPYIDGLRIQAGGDNVDEMIANNREIANFCKQHGKLIKFAEYPVNGVFDGFSNPKYGDELIILGKEYGNLFSGLDMYCTIPDVNAETDIDSFDWDNVDFSNDDFSVVKSFEENAKLNSIDFKWSDDYDSGNFTWYGNLDIEGTEKWVGYTPFDDGGISVYGNIWIIVKRPNGRWIAAPFEGYTNELTLHVFGNLNFEHKNILQNTELAHPWQPMSGEMYGWMVSNNVIYPGRNGANRTNIHWQKWP